jgi:FKBP-type peptidyl-prolyl cis-trans isomerase
MMAIFFHRQQIVARFLAFVVLLLAQDRHGKAQAWLISSPMSTLSTRRRILTILQYSSTADHDEPPSINADVRLMNRRAVLYESLVSLSTVGIMLLGGVEPAHALVKGNAPPPKDNIKSANTEKAKCTNVEECQALAEQKEQLERQEAEANNVPAQTTKGGTRYKDFEPGMGNVVVQDGDEVTVYYKVLKLGKRAYDGLSGEGTVVFSRGYGLEDDEFKPGDHAFVTTVGAPYNIIALNEAMIGMKQGGLRRFSIFPSKGWRRPGQACDGGPGGTGAGGDLKTDYVVVPTATMVATEACFDATKLPFPISYGEQRRMAQRFDQSLIMEVQVVSIASGGGLF